MADNEFKHLNVVLNPDVTIDVILDKTNKFLDGKLSREALDEWGTTITLVSNLPMLMKAAILLRLMSAYMYSNGSSTELSICELHKNIFFMVYLEGYMGIPTIPEEYMTYENYDKMEPIFGPWIESYAQRDINNFKELIRDVLNFGNLTNLMSTLSNVDVNVLKENTKINQELIHKLENNKDMISDLKEIAAFNDPTIKEMLDNVKTMALNTEESNSNNAKIVKKTTRKSAKKSTKKDIEQTNNNNNNINN